MNYMELRKKFHTFYYHDFICVENETTFSVQYHFEIEGLASFHPTFTLKKPDTKKYSHYQIIKQAAFSLGMVELVSYWKIACPQEVVIVCGALSTEQIMWWKKLYFHGLGEFFYVNQINAKMEDFMNIKATGNMIVGTPYHAVYTGNLIPVGGGKDSFVSLEILKNSFLENHVFIINDIKSAIHSAKSAGYKEDKCILVKRTLDEKMLELNHQGYLNGHTPFSAMVAFASYLTALIYQKRYICLSNEASANESTVKDSHVNHQYSKSFEFEKDFNTYISKYLFSKVEYFSLLRPLSELQITGIFSSLPSYLHIFRSCNVGQKTETWCGHCAKCLFVAIMLSAFLDNQTIISIFHRDILNDLQMLKLFEQLTGRLENKPFECVGTRDEVHLAINLSIKKSMKEKQEIPLLYRYFMEFSFYRDNQNENNWIYEWNDKNYVPSIYVKLIKEKLAGLVSCIN